MGIPVKYLPVLALILSSFTEARSFADRGRTVHISEGIGNPWNIDILLARLSRSQSGRVLIALARTKALETKRRLSDIIKVGDISVTDTTLVRKFSPSSPEDISYENRATIYINKDLDTLEAVLDLSHELVHFAKRGPFDPYDENFRLETFVSSMLEGQGGEVDAFLTECQVLSDLVDTRDYLRSHCRDIIDDEGKVDRDKGIGKFYQIGYHYEDFLQNLENQGIDPKTFFRLSNKQAIFISSAYGLPYPIAAYREFMSIKEKVCENDRRRLSLMEGRGDYNRLSASFNIRCR